MDKCSSQINESFLSFLESSCLKELWKTIDATDISPVPFPSLFTAPESDCFCCQVTHTSCPCHQCCGWLHHKDEQDKWCPTSNASRVAISTSNVAQKRQTKKTMLTRVLAIFLVGETFLVPKVLGKTHPIFLPQKQTRFVSKSYIHILTPGLAGPRKSIIGNSSFFQPLKVERGLYISRFWHWSSCFYKRNCIFWNQKLKYIVETNNWWRFWTWKNPSDATNYFHWRWGFNSQQTILSLLTSESSVFVALRSGCTSSPVGVPEFFQENSLLEVCKEWVDTRKTMVPNRYVLNEMFNWRKITQTYYFMMF